MKAINRNRMWTWTGCLLVLLMSVLCFTLTARADPEWSTAANIALETSVQGNVTNGYRDQQNVYRFSLANAGGITIQLNHPKQNTSDAYWRIRLYNSSYNEIYQMEVAGNYTSSKTPVMGLDKGSYYVIVESNDYWGASSQGIYTLIVHFDKSKNYEKELNENYLTATKISANTSYYGSTKYGYRDESDYYTFDLKAAGVAKIKFRHDMLGSTDSYWNVSLYNDAYDKMCEKEIYGNSEEYTLPAMGLAAGTYYIRVASSDYWSARSDSTYIMTVGYAISDQWEKELNESFNAASGIMTDKTYYGTTKAGNRDERDFYKLSVSSGGTYL